MSRHRNMRRVSFGDDDYDDEMSQSFDEKYSYAVSPGTSEMYMFNRNQAQNSMSEFIKGHIAEEDDQRDDDDENDDANTSATGGATAAASASAGFDSNLTDFMFQMDKAETMSTATKSKSGGAEKAETRSSSNLDTKTDYSLTASPRLQPKQAAQKTAALTPKNKQPAAGTSTPQSKQAQSIESSAKQLSDLKISALLESKKPIVDREELLKQYREHTSGKDVHNLIVIGHVDAGKSTLMGHLLFQLDEVSNKQMHKFKQESQKIGKSSFAYAWVLDETEEERERGVTIDIAQSKFETDKKIVYLLDAPGHKDFIPNMITGATQADSAILVINSVTGEFEVGMKSGNQTVEHALLAKSLGIQQIIVAVNKMDMEFNKREWSEERFKDICEKMTLFLTKQVGFKEPDIMFVPCSGLGGENLVKKCTNPKLTEWYKDGRSLLDCINQLRPTERPIDKPLRFCVSDVFKSPQSSAVSLAGKVESGLVKLGDKVIVVPGYQSGQVKSIFFSSAGGGDEQPTNVGFAGDSIILNLINLDINEVYVGSFLCEPGYPLMPVSNRIRARIVVFNLTVPITKGFDVVFHYKSMNEAAEIRKIVAQIDKNTGEVVKEKPRFLTKGMSALVEIKLVNKAICIELFQNFKELGRFMLRRNGISIAAGQVTQVIEGKSST